jgi:hypothetical protein
MCWERRTKITTMLENKGLGEDISTQGGGVYEYVIVLHKENIQNKIVAKCRRLRRVERVSYTGWGDKKCVQGFDG